MQTRNFSSVILFGGQRSVVGQCFPAGKQYVPVVDTSVKWWFDQSGLAEVCAKPLFLDEVDESVKSRDTRDAIEDYLLKLQASRSSVLVAIGGGVVLDTAGFAAATFKRGIPWFAIPTTPLAMVDASIGGKTAINVPAGKNLLGAFHPPAKVMITLSVSDTWTPTLRLEGTAEAYKIFRLFDHQAAKALAFDGGLEPWIESSVSLKAKVCEIDPWEENLRGALNYGHTFAHAIEHFTHLPHGLAVALGIRIENRVSEGIGKMSVTTRQRVDDDLDNLGFVIPTDLPSFGELREMILQDKKNVDRQIRLSLVGDDELPMTREDPTTQVCVQALEQAYQTFCSAA